jgi:uncharacterized Zn finger protein (UPF0148 family)
MNNYFCPDCGYQSYDDNEQICPHCNAPMEKIDFDDEMTNNDDEAYPKKIIQEEGDEDLSSASVSDDEMDYKEDKF